MPGLLDAAADLPVRPVAAGETILREGEASGAVWVLVDGRVEVRKGDLVVASVGEPGSPFGEMSALLAGPSTATVETVTPCRFRVADDGAAWLAANGDAVVEVARTLAARLRLVTGYLADLRRQYADADAGLTMIDEVLATLVAHDRPRAEPGSVRDPDPTS
jgi:CRP-like cAMP-binding protein